MHTRHTAGIWGEEQLKFCAAPLPFITCWIYENVWKQLKSDRCANFHLDMFGCSWDSLSGKWHSQGFTAVLWASFSSLDQYTQLQAQVSPCWLYTHVELFFKLQACSYQYLTKCNTGRCSPCTGRTLVPLAYRDECNSTWVVQEAQILLPCVQLFERY